MPKLTINILAGGSLIIDGSNRKIPWKYIQKFYLLNYISGTEHHIREKTVFIGFLVAI